MGSLKDDSEGVARRLKASWAIRRMARPFWSAARGPQTWVGPTQRSIGEDGLDIDTPPEVMISL